MGISDHDALISQWLGIKEIATVNGHNSAKKTSFSRVASRRPERLDHLYRNHEYPSAQQVYRVSAACRIAAQFAASKLESKLKSKTTIKPRFHDPSATCTATQVKGTTLHIGSINGILAARLFSEYLLQDFP